MNLIGFTIIHLFVLGSEDVFFHYLGFFLGCTFGCLLGFSCSYRNKFGIL